MNSSKGSEDFIVVESRYVLVVPLVSSFFLSIRQACINGLQFAIPNYDMSK